VFDPGAYGLRVNEGDVYINNNLIVGSFKIDDIGGHSHLSNVAGGGKIHMHTNGYYNNLVCYYGKVGIGIENMGGMLHIYGNSHVTYSYGGLLRLVSSSTNGLGSGNWGLINFPDANNSSGQSDNYYMIGRGHQYSDNVLSIHCPDDGSIDMCHTGANRIAVFQGNGDTYLYGDVGIGTTSPKERLDVGTGKICFKGATFNGTCGMSYYWGTQSTERPFILFDSGGSLILRSTDNNSTDGIRFQSYGGTERMFIRHDGNVGIGTTSPFCPLAVYGHTYADAGAIAYGAYANGWTSTSWASSDPIGIYSEKVIWSGHYIFASSDERIKENIVDVPDDLALQMVRDIPCRYYEYKDKVFRRNSNKTIGFIAQEVKEVLPMAVSIQKNIIPNEMRNLENISWEEITVVSL
jgi:hypothetical protein